MDSFNLDDFKVERKNILLTGRSGVGKTTAILKILENLQSDEIGGFWSREMLNKGKRVGFAFETLSGKAGSLAHRDLWSAYELEGCRVNMDDINSIIIPELIAARKSGKLILIDEIVDIFPRLLVHNHFIDEVVSCLETGRVLGTVYERTSNKLIREIIERQDVKMIESSSC